MTAPVTGMALAGTSDAAEACIEPPAGDPFISAGRFQFHQFVSLMEMLDPSAPPVGSLAGPAREKIRFRAARSLSFGAADMASVSRDAETGRTEIRVNFFGLYGPSSPLPPFYTERIIESGLAASGVEDLLDLFNHRLISLLHVVWRKHRHYLRYEQGGRDALSRRFLALSGFPVDDRDGVGGLSCAALLPYTGLLSLQSGSAEITAAVISGFFDIPCRIEEFVPRRVVLARDEQLALGVSNCLIGEDAVLGSAIEDDLGKFTVHLGPAPLAALTGFLPGAASHGELLELVAATGREPLEWDMCLHLDAASRPHMRLGETRIGWTSWLYADEPRGCESPVRIWSGDFSAMPEAASGISRVMQ